MLVVNYNGNKPVSDYFKFSVQGNNNADIVRFVLLKKQGSIDLTNEHYKVYVKVQTPELDFVDKTMLTTPTAVENSLVVDWTMLAKHTQFKQLQVSLAFENETSEIVWQTQLFTMNIANGVNADQELPNVYPSIIEQMEADIVELQQNMGTKLYRHSLYKGDVLCFVCICPEQHSFAEYPESIKGEYVGYVVVDYVIGFLAQGEDKIFVVNYAGDSIIDGNVSLFTDNVVAL